MKPYLLTRAAEDDLFEVWIYIAPNNGRLPTSLKAVSFKLSRNWRNVLTSAISGGT